MKGLIFTYALTYGGALVSLVDPFPGLLVYVCFAIVRPESMWYWSVPEGNYSRIVAVALLLGWLLRGLASWGLGRAGVVVALLVGFLAWAGLSSTQAANQAVAWGFVEELAKIVLPFLVGITTIGSPRRLRQLAWVIVLSHAYVALEMNLAYYDGFNRVREIGFGGMDNNCVAIAMVAAAGLTLFLGLNEPRWWVKAVALVSVLLMVHTVLFALSRGGMLALVLMGLVAFWLVPKRPIHLVLFAAVVLAGIRLAGAEVQQRFETSFVEGSERDESADSRLRLWADCWDVMAKNPMLGVGPHHWPLVAHTYGWPAGKEAHSLWFQTGAEMGIPGTVLIGLFYLTCVVRLWPVACGRVPVDDPVLCDLARAVIAALCGFSVAAQFVTITGLEASYYICLVGAGTLKLTSVPVAARPQTPETDPDLTDPAGPDRG